MLHIFCISRFFKILVWVVLLAPFCFEAQSLGSAQKNLCDGICWVA